MRRFKRVANRITHKNSISTISGNCKKTLHSRCFTASCVCPCGHGMDTAELVKSESVPQLRPR